MTDIKTTADFLIILSNKTRVWPTVEMCKSSQILFPMFDPFMEAMYFTSLPDHSQAGFDERAHFGQFKKHNIIFNALSTNTHCDDHVGCLSMKTVLTGAERYGIGSRQVTVRPGQFLMLNDDQNYSCHVDRDVQTATLSIFFKKDFAAAVCRDALSSEQASVDNPFHNDTRLEFFQTLIDVDLQLRRQLTMLTTSLQDIGLEEHKTDEYLIFILRHLIGIHQHESRKMLDVKAVRASTQTEIYKRLCIVKDLLHSNYMDKVDLQTMSLMASLSVPQLVRQFKSVFKRTPHQYLMQIRLSRATELLKTHPDHPLQEIAWQIGFENASAFGRAFKSVHGVQPGQFKKQLKK